MEPERLFKIRIVKDDPVARELHRRCLPQSNLRFESAETGGAVRGVELSKSWRPDCTPPGERAAELTRGILADAGKGAFCVERTDFNELVRETCLALKASIPAAPENEIGNCAGG